MPDPADRAPRFDPDAVSGLREAIETASGLIVCLDFDGTLAPIVDDPDDAAIRPVNRRFLRALADAPAVTVAVVSGRSLDDLRARVAVEGALYAGNHGLEWAGPDGRTVAEAARDTRRVLRATVERLDARLSDVPGCTIEDKGLTATVHYRRVPASAVPRVRETTAAVVESADGLVCRPGK